MEQNDRLPVVLRPAARSNRARVTICFQGLSRFAPVSAEHRITEPDLTRRVRNQRKIPLLAPFEPQRWFVSADEAEAKDGRWRRHRNMALRAAKLVARKPIALRSAPPHALHLGLARGSFFGRATT